MKRVKQRREAAKAREQQKDRHALIFVIVTVGLMVAGTVVYYWTR